MIFVKRRINIPSRASNKMKFIKTSFNFDQTVDEAKESLQKLSDHFVDPTTDEKRAERIKRSF